MKFQRGLKIVQKPGVEAIFYAILENNAVAFYPCCVTRSRIQSIFDLFSGRNLRQANIYTVLYLTVHSSHRSLLGGRTKSGAERESLKFKKEKHISKFKGSDEENAEDTVSVTDEEISIIEEKPGAFFFFFAWDDEQDALKTRPIERFLKEVASSPIKRES